jgi:DNA excision repair protein ERCC-2
VPSYAVLQALCATQLTSMIDKKIFIEKPGLSSSENDAIIQSFKKHSESGAVLLGVLSGRNSEGEDYPGKEMETVVVVGVPFAKPSPRESTRIDYFEHQFPQKGRVYGYLLPAMRSASQAAGRSVRRLEDRGAVVFLDDRYSTSYCSQFLPRCITERIKYLNDSDELLFKQLASFYARN